MRLLLSILLPILTATALADSVDVYRASEKKIPLTEKDRKTLEMGEISTARYVVGGVLGTYPIGFGVGHAVQGRWEDDGKIFTFGELGSAAVAAAGALGCMERRDGDDHWDCSSLESGLIVLGAVGFVGLRIWEIVDVWATPPAHNSRHRRLKEYIDNTPVKPEAKASLNLTPLVSPKFGQGIGLRYTF